MNCRTFPHILASEEKAIVTTTSLKIEEKKTPVEYIPSISGILSDSVLSADACGFYTGTLDLFHITTSS